MNQPQPRHTHDSFASAIASFRNGDPGAADRLTESLREVVARNVRQFLGADHADVEDITQETLLATLRYLERDRAFQGDLGRLAATIARNRCRDLHRWTRRRPSVAAEDVATELADPRRSVLDDLERTELILLLQRSLDQLSSECQHLLRGTYVEGRSVESLRRELGLETVQGVYYRRSVCLDRLRRFLKARLWGRSERGEE